MVSPYSETSIYYLISFVIDKSFQVLDGFIPRLVTILDTDPDENCRFKALSAISCLIRDNPEGQEEFLKLNGCEVVLRNIQTSKIRLRVKVSIFSGHLG